MKTIKWEHVTQGLKESVMVSMKDVAAACGAINAAAVSVKH